MRNLEGACMELPKRKPNRLKNFDYSSAGAYFVTICTEDRKCLLGKIVGEDIILPNYRVQLSRYGKTVDNAIKNISAHYENVTVDKYVIMPNHVHLILMFENSGRIISSPTVSTVVGQMKRYASKEAGISLWQRSFHDHVIRNEEDYLKIWEYIEYNACKWKEDCFYVSD